MIARDADHAAWRHLGFTPPLTRSRAEADRIAAITKAAVNAVANSLR